MKKAPFLFLFVAFILNFNAQKVDLPNNSFLFDLVKVSEYQYDIKLKLNEINFTNIQFKNSNFSKIDIPGFFEHHEIGSPALSQMNQIFEIPLNGNCKIEVVAKKSKLIDLNTYNLPQLYPHQKSISKGEDATKVLLEYNKKAYGKDKFIKYDIAALNKVGVLRKHQLARLEICPFEYNPVKNQLIVYYDLDIKVTFLNSSLEKERQGNNLYNQSEFLPLINNCINSSIKDAKDFITTYPTTYVIVSDRSFQQQIQPLVEWKTMKGFKVIEAYTDDPSVGNTTASIKAYLQNLYNNPSGGTPPSYILLVGDIAEIPSFSGLYGTHVSDLYYAEYDGNGDFYADVYYGRFSSSDPVQIQNMVIKTIDYEKYSFQDPSFLDNAVMISGVDAAMAPTYGNGQINYANQYYTNTANGINASTYLYPASGSSSSQIIQDINNGCSFANYTAHGYGQGWADPAFTCTDVHNMTNIGKPAMMIGNCCQSNKFDDPECFGEALLRVDNKGAIGYIGGSNNTYWNEDFWWSVGAGTITTNPVYNANNLAFYDRLFHLNGEPTNEWYTTNSQIMMGGNLAVTQANGADDYYCEIYHLMGDPSLMTYFGTPNPLLVQHDQVIPLGLNTVDVNTEDGAYVAISQNGTFLDAGLVGSNGLISMDISAVTSMDSLEVVVTKQNKIPYFGSIQIMPPNGVFLSNSSNVFNDVSGNSNGAIDFNEIIEIHTTIKNYGNINATGVYAKLTSTSSYVTVLDDSSYWGGINAGVGTQINAAYKFKVDGTVADQELLPFQLEIFDDQGAVWNTFFNVNANAPISNVVDVIVDDHQFGNDNGRLDPGELLTLFLPIKNEGHADNVQLVGDITSNNMDVQFISSSFNLGALTVTQQMDTYFNVMVHSSVTPGTIVTFTVDLHDGDYTNQYQFDLVVGLMVEDFNSGGITTSGWINNNLFPWTSDSNVYYNANYSYRSTNVAHSTTSILELQLDVIANSDLSFMKKVSSEANYDYLKFYIDNIEKESWSGEDDWSYHAYPVTPGTHNFKWEYEKDYSVNSGADAAWIDEVVFPIVATSNVGISPSTPAVDITLYPIPVDNQLYVSTNDLEIVEISVWDVFGRVVKLVDLGGEETQLLNISTADLSDGTYFLRVETKNSYINKRFIVAR
mgnify:CR=1 FL=1